MDNITYINLHVSNRNKKDFLDYCNNNKNEIKKSEYIDKNKNNLAKIK